MLHSTHLSGAGNGIKSFYKTVFNNLTRYKAIRRINRKAMPRYFTIY
ncbi:hypothetical protein ACVNPX_07115 [Staphylococcus aureus]